jgi:hypothetical protein
MIDRYGQRLDYGVVDLIGVSPRIVSGLSAPRFDCRHIAFHPAVSDLQDLKHPIDEELPLGDGHGEAPYPVEGQSAIDLSAIDR